ncbi:MAG: SBBP repeat-containing protein, partial [Planctomycetes bacterium]|nr:SBBP repeat-containing protein [Planctomycetota bacterium]
MGRPLKEKVTQEIQKLQAPFIANNGQIDGRVRFYAQTFRGTVFVTKDGEIVYSLPEVKQGSEGIKAQEGNLTEDCQLEEARGITLKEQLVGSNISEIKGGAKSTTVVSYFTGHDPSKWQSNVSTYEIVDMGEVYEGIDLRLKAYGNNVEKLFTVRPDANHETIRIKLAGAQELTVNESGELVAETELGAVKFTKPVAYQEIDGKRVEVAAEYSIYVSETDGMESRGNGELGSRDAWGLGCGGELETRNPKPEIRNSKPETQTSKLIYGFTVAAYDKTKDLIIDPLIASTYLGGVYEDYGRSIAIDAGGNVYVVGETLSSDLPTTPGAYDT